MNCSSKIYNNQPSRQSYIGATDIQQQLWHLSSHVNIITAPPQQHPPPQQHFKHASCMGHSFRSFSGPPYYSKKQSVVDLQCIKQLTKWLDYFFFPNFWPQSSRINAALGLGEVGLSGNYAYIMCCAMHYSPKSCNRHVVMYMCALHYEI